MSDIANSIINILALASIVFVFFLGYKKKIKLGFSVDKWISCELLSGFVISFLPVSIAFVTLWSAGYLEVLSIDFKPDTFLSSTLMLSISALAEEFLFRTGLLLALIYITKNIWVSVSIEIVLFGTIHMLNPGAGAFTVISNSMGGLMYSLAFIYTGRIWMPFMVHMVWNLSQAFYGFNISGIDKFSDMFLVINPVGNDLLSGGSYGLEGSLVGMGARLLVILLIMFTVKQLLSLNGDYERLKLSILPEILRKHRSV